MMKAREVIKLIENAGWYLIRQKGSHKQYKHSAKKGIVTIAAHKQSDEIAPAPSTVFLSRYN